MSFIANLLDCEAKVGTWVSAGPDAGSKACAVAPKSLANMPQTSLWRREIKVKGNMIQPGTAIATFPVLSAGIFLYKGHAAIYISQTPAGILVYDQWETKSFGKRLIRFKCSGDVSDDGEAFYVVELIETKTSNPALCGPASTYHN